MLILVLFLTGCATVYKPTQCCGDFKNGYLKCKWVLYSSQPDGSVTRDCVCPQYGDVNYDYSCENRSYNG